MVRRLYSRTAVSCFCCCCLGVRRFPISLIVLNRGDVRLTGLVQFSREDDRIDYFYFSHFMTHFYLLHLFTCMLYHSLLLYLFVYFSFPVLDDFQI